MPHPEKRARPQRIEVIVNPAPARRVPLLGTLNKHFREAGIAWDVAITHRLGDAAVLAKRAVENGADMVVAYGGDGTVMEVAGGLVGTDVPLLILSGGTGNLVAAELKLPQNLDRGCALVTGDAFTSRNMDIGRMGDRPFLLRVGSGIETGVVQDATREMKNQFGKWAYVFAALKRLQEVPEADYELTLDNGETFATRGVACAVANSGTTGFGQLPIAPSVRIDDGKLDVFFMKKANIEGIFHLARKMVGLGTHPEHADQGLDASKLMSHWQVERVTVKSDPILDIQVDGDVVAQTPQTIEVVPSALRVVVPKIVEQR